MASLETIPVYWDFRTTQTLLVRSAVFASITLSGSVSVVVSATLLACTTLSRALPPA